MIEIGIKELLTWAFVQELWKVGAGGGASVVVGSAWSKMSEYAALGTLIDKTPNEFGLIPGFQDGAPDPDALAVGRMVKALPVINVPAWLDLAGDWPDPHGLVAAEIEFELTLWQRRGPRAQTDQIVNLVKSCAVLERAPAWRGDYPGDRLIMRNGKPAWFIKRRKRDVRGGVYDIEADGYDQKAGKPLAGAYRKYELREPIRSTIASRIDWYLWQSALAWLADALADQLMRHRIRPFVPVYDIWMKGNADLSTAQSGAILG